MSHHDRLETTVATTNAAAAPPDKLAASTTFRRERTPSLDLRVFVKDVHDVHGRKRPLQVRPWSSVKDLKDQLSRHLHVPASSQSIYFGPLLSSARELPNHRTLQDAGIYRNGETLLLEIKGRHCSSLLSPSPSDGGVAPISSLRNRSDVCVSSSTLDLCPKALQRMVQQSRRGMAVGFKPLLAPDGSGGSYFLSDARRKRVGVFKPADEEPFAENNPRGYVPHSSIGNPSNMGGGDGGNDGDAGGLRQGIRPGELCLREVAAYLLDHGGFSSVPMTTLAEARHPALHSAGSNWTLSEGGAGVGAHSIRASISGADLSTIVSTPSNSTSPPELVKKVGSFQEYVTAECTMDDISPSKITVGEVHKIAILDMRLMNADRNVANILCQRIPEDPDQFRLVPIDHGYSLRSKCDVAWFDWCWLDWPQVKEPLSEEARSYVLNLDIEADVAVLEERLKLENDVLDNFRNSCLVLKAGVKAGLTLYDIASEILCRNDPSGETPSKFETLTTMANELAMTAVHNGRFHHSTASLALEEQLSASTSQRTLLPRRTSKRFPSSNACKSSGFLRSTSLFSVPSLGRESMGGESVFTDDLFKQDTFSSEMFDSRPGSFVGAAGCSRSPEMLQSSQSDDNSSHGDAGFLSEPEEDEFGVAGEWAAALVAVADQSMDLDATIQQAGRSRNDSICSATTADSDSSTMLSKSPVGFWHVRPGASSVADTSEEDGSISWTPSLHSSNRDVASDVNDIPPHILPPSGFSSLNLEKLMSEANTESPCDENEDVAPLSIERPKVSGCGFLSPSYVPPDSSLMKKSMVRSMSYTAFSTTTPPPDTIATKFGKNPASNVLMRSSLSTTHANEIFRTYYLKFVDLLAVREIERIMRSKAPLEATAG